MWIDGILWKEMATMDNARKVSGWKVGEKQTGEVRALGGNSHGRTEDRSMCKFACRVSSCMLHHALRLSLPLYTPSIAPHTPYTSLDPKLLLLKNNI